MKKITIIIFMIFFSSYSAFTDFKPSAKGAGMGYAYTSRCNDADALYYNPSNISFITMPNLTIGYNKLYMGLDKDSLGLKSLYYAIPSEKIGAFGAGILVFDNNFYGEHIYSLSYSNSIKGDEKEYSFGLTFKMLRKFFKMTYSKDIANDPFFDEYGTRVTNYTGDIGFSMRKYDSYTLSLVLKNITRPDLAFMKDDILPMIINVGLLTGKFQVLL